MTHLRNVFCLLLWLASMHAATLFAQSTPSKYDPATFRDEPVWIDMMNDPNANFFETLAAFRTFWEGYIMPEEPEELEKNGRFKRDIGMKDNKPVSRDPQAEAERKNSLKKRPGRSYDFEVKQFKGWLRDVQPWVQADGRILTEEERQKIVDQQQKELKAIEQTQKN